MPDEPYAAVHFKAFSPFKLHDTNYGDEGLETRSRTSQLVDAFKVWALAVSAYTQGSLTKEDDKLVAISAIAREVQPLMQCRYLAGHWDIDLVQQLGWSGANHSSRPNMYRAPSWSWASIDGPIQQFYHMYDEIDHYYPLIEILEACVNLASDDEMGQVQCGYLTLLGQTVDLDILHSDVPRYGPGTQSIIVHGQRTKLWLLEDNEMERISKPTSQFCCLLLDLSLGNHPNFNGLVLGHTGEANNIYRRVGLLSPSLGTDLNIEDFLNDPLLLLAGQIQWGKDGTPVFARDTSALKEITII